jgi:hypothetical protein
VPAFAREQGADGAAGLLLALFAGGSVLGGMLYGARPSRESGGPYGLADRVRRPPWRQGWSWPDAHG